MAAGILYVESNASLRQRRCAVLSDAGFHVYETGAGHEALSRVRTLLVDVVVLGTQLPDMEGAELCRRLKRAEPCLAVLLLQDPGASSEAQVEGLSAGAGACLLEPSGPDLLVAQVRALLRERAGRAEHGDDPTDSDLAPEPAERPSSSSSPSVWQPELADVVDLAEIRSLMEDFHRVAGIPMGLVDTRGNVLVGVGWQTICSGFHRVHPESCEHCVESDVELSAGIRAGEFRLYKCKNHMWDVATPIVVGDHHMGFVFSGQFFFDDERIDRELFRRQALQYGFDEPAYLTALDAAPRVSRAFVNASVAFFVRLARVLSQLGHSNLKLQRAMAERCRLMRSLRQREEQLRVAAGRLTEANAAKDQFLMTLSHELRTPLSAIVGWSQMLIAGTVRGDAAGRALDVIYRNAQVQTRLIDDVLDVSRIVAGKLRLEIRPTDVVPVVGAAIEALRPSADAKGITMTTAFDSVPPIAGDPARLQQVFVNLLSNAVKFTPSGGHVDVSVAHVESGIEVRVADSGVGIDQDFLPHVFERFRQYDSSMTRLQGGLGLGLAIVRHLVHLHGGRVEAFSGGAGHGTRFTVTLPTAIVSGQGAHEALESFRPGPAPRLDGLRVLVVDDDAETREWVDVVLTASGARVNVAASAADALTQIAGDRFDVIISDIGMPEVDGCGLMRAVRQQGVQVPAIALSGYGRVEDRDRALAVGFDRHLTKPVLPADLVAAVARARA